MIVRPCVKRASFAPLDRSLGFFSLIVLGAASVSACRADERPALGTSQKGAETAAPPAPPPVAETASAESAVPPQVASPEHSIVWGSAANGPESFLLEWQPPVLKVLGRRAGALLFGSGGVYRWKQTVGTAQLFIDCDEAWTPPEEPNLKNRVPVSVKGAKLVRLDAAEEIELAALPSPEQATSYDNEFTLQASVGSYVFFTERSDETYCTAAHPSWGYYPHVYDLATRAFVELTKEDEQALRAEAQSLSKKTRDCAEAVRMANSLMDKPEPGGIEQMGFESVWPTWSKKRGLGFLVGFTAMQSYAAGKHDCQVEVSSAPPSFAGFRVPDAFAALPKKLPQLGVQGWSILPAGDEESFARAAAAFKLAQRRTQ